MTYKKLFGCLVIPAILLVVVVIVVILLISNGDISVGDSIVERVQEENLFKGTDVPETQASTSRPENKNDRAITGTDVPRAEPSQQTDDEIVLLGGGTYLNGFQDAHECYQITQSDLDSWLEEDTLILFEGELCDALSVHQIMLVDEPLGVNQGSFWLFKTGEGDLAEDVLMAFAHDKWQNWESQGITSLPIIVHLPDGNQIRFSKGEEPTLTEGQQELVEQNEAERCPSGSDPIEETPFSDSEGDSHVEGAPGSFACLTLFVPADGDKVFYFVGAQDNFPYNATGAKFYLAPKDWTEQDIENWASERFGERDAVELPF